MGMIKGLPSVPGKVADELLVSNEPISFGVDMTNLQGRSLTGAIR
jgi:hypothetical protein